MCDVLPLVLRLVGCLASHVRLTTTAFPLLAW